LVQLLQPGRNGGGAVVPLPRGEGAAGDPRGSGGHRPPDHGGVVGRADWAGVRHRPSIGKVLENWKKSFHDGRSAGNGPSRVWLPLRNAITVIGRWRRLRSPRKNCRKIRIVEGGA